MSRTKARAALPAPFRDWFARRGWAPRPHQHALLAQAAARRSTLLVAPTGGGKTLAGFLPSLVQLAGARAERRGTGLHTLYLSPLKALAVDVARNLMAPVAEMGLAVTVETRTGDTPPDRRRRQRLRPPDILMTTPEQLALLLSHADSAALVAGLDTLILDELHALAPTKRGDLLALGMARLSSLAPGHVRVGLSATVARPSELRAFLAAQDLSGEAPAIRLADLVVAGGGAEPDVTILEAGAPPWAGHTCRHAMSAVYDAIRRHRLALLFVNTRSQAELVFQELWRLNEEVLPIALHHGSLDVSQRRKVEKAMAEGRLRAVVATSTLDLGIDWGDVDLVVNIGAPKGASRLIQRIGRANHRLDEPSRAILVPGNRFEVLECRAALEAARAGAQDARLERTGGLDVLAQHVATMAAAGPFAPDALFAEVRSALPYAALPRATFDRAVDLVATGGYALRTYERFARLRPSGEGRLRLAHPRLARQIRLNIGTIVESPMIRLRLVGGRSARPGRATGRPGAARVLAGGRILGEIDEDFIGELSVGDTFAFGGEVVRLEGQSESEAFVSRAFDSDPRIPVYPGGKFPLSTHLAARVRAMLADPRRWRHLPAPVAEWLALQRDHSELPAADGLLVETFPWKARHYLVAYPFEGRLAHQTLGMLLTRRLERAGARPLGFVCNDYALSVWGLGDMSALITGGRLSLGALFDRDMLGDDLDAWLAESSLMRRAFRYCATIAGLIERRHPGQEKTVRQMSVSSNLIYDVLRRHDPHHILLEATWADAASGLLDIARLGAFLGRIEGRIRHRPLGRVSPLAVPVLLEIGREQVGGDAGESLLREAAEAMLRDAAGEERREARDETAGARGA
jgi:ATP-dependent Lhr-like helicase